MDFPIDIEGLKRAHPMADVAERYGVGLRRQGRLLVGRCPFHPDGGRPNLYVYPETSSFYCFRCAFGGDVITFVRRLEGCSFGEALARLDGSIALTRRASRRHALPTRRAPDADERACVSAAADFYHGQLLRTDAALKYLDRRGISPQSIRLRHLGYCSGRGLRDYLGWRRLPLGAAARRGLLTPRGEEVFAGRVLVPEWRNGQAVWLIGRTIEDGREPRYLGLRGHRPLIGWEDACRSRWVVLIEGVFDWLFLRQWRLPALALTGTHVRPQAIAALRRFHCVYLALDNDEAGHAAAAVLSPLIGTAAHRVELPGVKDVAELGLRPEGRERFMEVLGGWHAQAAWLERSTDTMMYIPDQEQHCAADQYLPGRRATASLETSGSRGTLQRS